MPVNITAQPTPNPNAMKFSLDTNVTTGSSKTFASAQEAAADPLAAAIFQTGGIRQVFFLNNFLTVTKEMDAGWDAIVPSVEQAVRGHFA